MKRLASGPMNRSYSPGTAAATKALPPGAVLRRVFGFPVLLGGLLVLVVFIRICVVPFVEGDTWWHLTVGEQILATGRWPVSDTYSFTALGTYWIAYEWLGEVIMAVAFRLGGLAGLMAFTLGLGATLVSLVYYYAWLESRTVKGAFLASFALLPLIAAYFTLRPQLIGYIFFVVTLICLAHFRRGRSRLLWLLPPLFFLWANTHGSFVFGLLALGLYWAGGLARFRLGSIVAEPWTDKQRLYLGVCFLLCVIALTLTPYGTRLAAYPLEMALLQPVNTSTNGEFQPVVFQGMLWKLLLVLLLLFFLLQVIAPYAYRVEDIALLLFAIYAACAHRRFILLLAPVFAPRLASQLASWVPAYQPAKDRFVVNAFLLVLILAGMLAYFPNNHELEAAIANKQPYKAAEYLRQHPVAGPVLNDYDWGGYLSRYLGPEHKVFIDGRADIYEYAGILPDYFSLIRLKPNTLFLLRKYGVRACLLRASHPLSTLLAALPDWERAYWDELSAIYVHKRSHPPLADGGEPAGESPTSLAPGAANALRNGTQETAPRPQKVIFSRD